MLLVISLSLMLEWFAVWGWVSLVSTESSVVAGGAYLFGIWSFAFLPALLGAAGVAPFYPAGESLAWRLTVALIFSLGAGALRYGVEYAVWGPAFLAGPLALEALLSVAVPFSCIALSMYLAKSQTRAVRAERLMAELEFESRHAALERENAELRVRREVSAMLHDHVQQRLVFAASRLQAEVIPMAQVNDDQVAIALLREIIADIDRLREDDVRQLSHSLFPVGADIGLHQAVALAIGRVPASVSVELDVSESAAAFDTVVEPALDIASRAVLVSVLDEAITNALKHGSAKAIRVTLDIQGDGAGDDAARQLILRVANDGLPLVEGAWPTGGLAGHQARLESRSGGLILRPGESGEAGGAEVVAWLPVPEGSEAIGSADGTGLSGSAHPAGSVGQDTLTGLPEPNSPPEPHDLPEPVGRPDLIEPAGRSEPAPARTAPGDPARDPARDPEAG
jgi:signal transduction histidine kinase